MTGREMIVYILDNNLLDTEIQANGFTLGYISVDDAAIALDMGEASVRALARNGELDLLNTTVDGELYCLYVSEKSVKEYANKLGKTLKKEINTHEKYCN